jgi:hypothetical protein
MGVTAGFLVIAALLAAIIGRWHDTASRTGVAIVESSDPVALNRYLGQWNPVMDLEAAPVLDDEETAALARGIVEDHGD